MRSADAHHFATPRQSLPTRVAMALIESGQPLYNCAPTLMRVPRISVCVAYSNANGNPGSSMRRAAAPSAIEEVG
jgi:hypothetical protein